MAHLRTSCQRKVSSKIFPFLANSQWKFLRCLSLPAVAGVENCPILQATVNVKLGPLLAYTSVLVFFWFLVVFTFFGVFFGDFGF